MHRTSFVVAVLVILALLLPAAVATAQDASPAASPVAGQPLDLAAMALVPADFDIPGLGFGFAISRTLDQDAAVVADESGKDSAAVREALAAAGWQGQYLSRLQAPEVYGAEDPVLAQRVTTYVREFADPEGAAAGFAFIEDESDLPSADGGATPVAEGATLADDVPGTRMIGDESEITRLVGIFSATGVMYRGLDLTFRSGNLVAGVGLYDYTGGEPDVAEVEALAQTYLERIEWVRAEGAPGLSNRIVRLDAPDIVASRDGYDLLGGDAFPDYNESAEAFAARSGRSGEASDIYFVSQRLPAGSAATGDDVAYQNYLYRFPDEAAAADWIVGGRLRLQIPSYVSNTGMAGAPTIGDESRTIGIHRRSGERDTYGYVIYVRVGREVIDMRLFAHPEAPLATLQELAQAQVACLRSTEPCERVAVPAALMTLAERASATPVATPAAGTPAP